MVSAFEYADKYSAKRRITKRHRIIAAFLSVAAALCTFYALKRPAAALELFCELEEHEHAEECYNHSEVNLEQILACSYEALGGHEHSADCFDENGSLICGCADFILHTHTSSCYDDYGELICELDEIEPHEHTKRCFYRIPAHEHDEDCYAVTAERLICGLDEDDEHIHSDECYASEIELVCELDESESVFSELICDQDELCEHSHCADCFDEGGSLICGMLELFEHEHGKSCFITIETPVDESDGAESVCGLAEHTHSSSCYEAYTDEAELSLVSGVEAMIAELPDYDELAAILEELEQCENDDEYNAYLIYISAQAQQAYEAYTALPEALSEQVENIDRLMALEPLWLGQTLEAVGELDIFQVNNYGGAYNLLIYGGSSSSLNIGMSFKFWTAIVVEGGASGLYVKSIDTSTNSKSSLAASTADGFVIFTQRSVTAEVGDSVSVSFNYKLSKAYTGSAIGTVSFSSAPETSEKPKKNNAVDIVSPADTYELIELNLYNYGDNANYLYENVSNSYPGFQQDNGTKSVSSLGKYSFNFGNNITSDLAAGDPGVTKSGTAINKLSDKGVNYPISGGMSTELIDGYPALSDGTSLAYLFTDSSYAEKMNTDSINGLFQKNSKTGSYYYNSRENHAQYNGDNTFTLYKQIITSNFMMYPFGNFLPFNDIKTQCAQTSTIDRSYISEIKDSALLKSRQYTEAENSDAYGFLASSLSSFISLMDDRYSGVWDASDCINEYFSVSGLDLTVEQGSAQLRRLYSIDYDEPTDFYFGMEMTMNFVQPRGGLTGNDGMQPMEFSFSGDDDVWVYIDGVLFLDLSGIHRHVGGKIDFVNGIVEYYALDPSTGDISAEPYQTVNFSDLVSEDALNDSGTFRDYTHHSFNFYYMERGSGSGVCRLEFNFPLLRKNSISVTKQLSVDSEDVEKLLGNPDFSFQVLAEDGESLFIAPYTEYHIIDSSGNTIKSGLKTDENGVFTLKANETAVFEQIQEDSGKYFVRELLDRDFFEQYGKIIVDGTEETIDYNVSVGTDYFHGINSLIKDVSSGSTIFTFNNHVSTENLGTLSITKKLLEHQETETSMSFDFKITLDGEPLPVGTAYVVGTATRYSKAGGIITLAPDETATISGILAGSRFTVEETAEASQDYTVKYCLNGQEQSESASGVVGVKADAAVEIQNIEKGAFVEIPLEKALLMPDGREHTYTFRLEQVESADNPVPLSSGLVQTLEISVCDRPESDSFVISYPQIESDSLPCSLFYIISEDKVADADTIFDESVYLIEVSLVPVDSSAEASIAGLWKDGVEQEPDSRLSFTNTLIRYELPDAGGAGSTAYTVSGIALLSFALLWLITVKSCKGAKNRADVR